jgi:hypothetical protein
MKKYVLVDTSYTPSYEDYLCDCEANLTQPRGENSEDYWDFVSSYQQMEWEDFLLNLEGSKTNKSYYWIITGKLGLWDGVKDIRPVKCDTLKEAILKCVEGLDSIKVEKKSNVIYITGVHHDGQNCFEIRALSNLGNDRFNRHSGHISINNKENIAKLPEYLF